MNKTLVRVWVRVRAWIKIYIRHTENMELLSHTVTSACSCTSLLTIEYIIYTVDASIFL